MAIKVVGTEPQCVLDGDKSVWITTNGEFYYGFGDEPDTWHMYYTIKEAITFGPEFGKVWIKASGVEDVCLSISESKN